VYFDNSVRPINVVVMLDTSGSMTLTIDLLKRGAEQFVIRLLPEDKGRVGAFNDKVQISSRFTSDRDELVTQRQGRRLRQRHAVVGRDGDGARRAEAVDGRRVVLVFTDGDDTDSRTRSGTVIERARADETMVYAIGLESNYFNGQRMSESKPDRGFETARRRNRRRVLRAREDERSRADLHAGRARAAQPVRDRVRADAARQPRPQASGEDEAARARGARAPQLRGRSR
jgi:hypothetical protein